MLCDFEEVKRIVDDFWYEAFGLRLRTVRKEALNCGVGKYVTVYPDGSVYPCHLLAFPELCIGNVREQRLHSIYSHSSLMERLRSLHFDEIAQCAECFEELSREVTCLGTYAQEQNFREELMNLLGREAGHE